MTIPPTRYSLIRHSGRSYIQNIHTGERMVIGPLDGEFHDILTNLTFAIGEKWHLDLNRHFTILRQNIGSGFLLVGDGKFRDLFANIIHGVTADPWVYGRPPDNWEFSFKKYTPEVSLTQYPAMASVGNARVRFADGKTGYWFGMTPFMSRHWDKTAISARSVGGPAGVTDEREFTYVPVVEVLGKGLPSITFPFEGDPAKMVTYGRLKPGYEVFW